MAQMRWTGNDCDAPLFQLLIEPWRVYSGLYSTLAKGSFIVSVLSCKRTGLVWLIKTAQTKDGINREYANDDVINHVITLFTWII